LCFLYDSQTRCLYCPKQRTSSGFRGGHLIIYCEVGTQILLVIFGKIVLKYRIAAWKSVIIWKVLRPANWTKFSHGFPRSLIKYRFCNKFSSRSCPMLIRNCRPNAGTKIQHLCSNFPASFFCCLYKALYCDHFTTFSTSQRFNLLQNCLWHKEERALPGTFRTATILRASVIYTVSHT
jgi:hypothetical protein